MFKKVALAALLAAVICNTAEAATTTTTFNVTATFAQTCSVVTTGSVPFGSFGNLGTVISSSAYATLDITCSQGTPYAVTLTSSNPGGGTNFNMTNGTNLLAYKLFPSVLPNVTAFDNTGASALAPAVGTGTGASAISLFISGQMQAQTAPGAGWGNGGTAYTDVVTATLTY